MSYNTEFEIKLIPHGSVSPKINYGINDQVAGTVLELSVPMILRFNLDFEKGLQTVFIEFFNKTNNTPDTALEIDSVTFEGITVERFKWAGVYYPNYPEPWASSQTDLPASRPSMTYLGWNGRWELTFDTPIFQWIHRLEHLGWIYD